VKHLFGTTVVLFLIGAVSAGFLYAGDSKAPVNHVVVVPPVDVVNPDQVVAIVNKQPITMGELQKPLVEAYGLKILLYQAQLTLAKQWAEQQKVTMTQADYDAELERTEKAGFAEADKADYPALLQQLLEKKGTSRVEFDMVLQTRAILRKIAEPQLRNRISDDNINEAFNVMYGETVSIRHIQCANPQEALQARTRLAADEKFETVVRMMSRNIRTRELDGELPPFSRNTVDWGSGWGKVPQGFKDWAFNAKVGDISEPIQADGGYHILKLEKRLAPKAVKLTDDLKKSIRATLEDQLMEQGIGELQLKLAGMARTMIEVKDPTMKKQYDAKMEQAKSQAEEKVRNEALSHMKPATLPSTRPVIDLKTSEKGNTVPQGTPAPVPGKAASPADASTGERPPATKSAETPADKK